MDNKIYQDAVKEAIKPAFGRKRVLPSKYIPQYPRNAEREMKSVMTAYMKILKNAMKEHLPEIMAAYKRERHGDARYDDLFNLRNEIGGIFQKIAAKVEQGIADFDLKGKIAAIAGRTKRTTFQEWKRCVQKTVGIDLIENYYTTAFYSDLIQQWVDESVSMIQSVPQQELDEMRRIIGDGFKDGLPIDEIAKQIQSEYNTSKSKAQFIARDQIGLLNSTLMRRQQEDAGVKKYKWKDSGDSRVRDCHHTLNGKVFNWNDPPEMWITKKGGRVYTGRRCHPGQDYGCRCTAIPVFEYDELDLPIERIESNAKKGLRLPDFGVASIFTSQRKEG